MNIKTHSSDLNIWDIQFSNTSVSINGINYPIELLKQIVADNIEKCKFENCENKIYSRGYCHSHYRGLRKAKKLAIISVKLCELEGCSKPHHAKGYCMLHYTNLIRRPKRRARKADILKGESNLF